jgi:hypothetical protein
LIRTELAAHWAAEGSSAGRDSYEGHRLLQVRTLEAYAGVATGSGGGRFVAIRLNSNQRRIIADRYPRSSKGIVVETVEGGAGRVAFFLREQAGIPSAVFPAVMEDVLSSADTAPPGKELRSAMERFASWQAALSRPGGAMSAQEVRGIIGELVVARDLLAASLGFERAVQVWRAPDDDHIHDFAGQGWELEVKTSMAPETQFHVSAEGQLEPEHGNRMFLATVEVEPSAEGMSLSGMVEQLLANAALPGLRDALRNAIIRRGALSQALDGEAARQYRIVSTNVFEVRDEFPLILRRTLPGGVSAIRYQVSLAACQQFRVDAQAVGNSLKTMEQTP